MHDGRKLEPIVDPKGQITNWRCSSCAWTSARNHNFTGMMPSPAFQQAYEVHLCQHHPRDPEGTGDIETWPSRVEG